METKRLTANCCVVGAGPSGLLLSLLLARRGRTTVLLERKAGHEPAGAGPAPIIQPLTLRILDRLGVMDDLLAGAVRIESVEEYGRDGLLFEQSFAAGQDGAASFALSTPMGTLKQALLAAIGAESGVSVLLEATVDRLRRNAGRYCTVAATVADRPTEIDVDFVVACDGKFSAIRDMIGIGADVFLFDRRFLRISIPRPFGWPSSFRVHQHAHGQVILSPAVDGALTVLQSIDTAVLTELHDRDVSALIDQMSAVVPDLEPLLRSTLTDWDQVIDIPQHLVRTDSWFRDNAVLLGDSAHGLHPLGGQGMNTSLQDAVLLADLLDRLLAGDPAADLSYYEKSRRPYIDEFQRFQREQAMLSARPANGTAAVDAGMERDALDATAVGERELGPLYLELAGRFPSTSTTTTGEHNGR